MIQLSLHHDLWTIGLPVKQETCSCRGRDNKVGIITGNRGRGKARCLSFPPNHARRVFRLRKQLTDRLSDDRMYEIRNELGEWHEDKSSRCDARVWEFQKLCI